MDPVAAQIYPGVSTTAPLAPISAEIEVDAPVASPTAPEARAEPHPSPTPVEPLPAPRAVERPREPTAPSVLTHELPLATTAGEPWSLSPIATGGPRIGTLVGDGVGDAVRAGIEVTVAESQRRERAAAPRHGSLPGQSARDMDLGLVPGGELVAVAREATHRSLVPTACHAVLEFEVDPSGVVISGRPIDVSADHIGWVGLANEIVTLADGKRLRPSASGLLITIDVTSALKSIGGATQTDSHGLLDTVGSVVGAIADPLGTIASHAAPPLRVVSARVVDVRAH